MLSAIAVHGREMQETLYRMKRLGCAFPSGAQFDSFGRSRRHSGGWCQSVATKCDGLNGAIPTASISKLYFLLRKAGTYYAHWITTSKLPPVRGYFHFRVWPLAAMPASECRGSFRG